MAAKKPAAKTPAKEAKAEVPPKAVKTPPAAKGAKSARSPGARKAEEPPKGTGAVQKAKAPPRKRAEATKGAADAGPAVIEIETLFFDRDRMVAEAAYYRAERRGFSPGAELEDWLGAEAEIDRLMGR
jgi:hypothetical protein